MHYGIKTYKYEYNQTNYSSERTRRTDSENLSYHRSFKEYRKKVSAILKQQNLNFDKILLMSDYEAKKLFFQKEEKPLARYEELEKMFPYIEKQV